MDELDRHIRDLIDAGAQPVTADEIRHRATTPLAALDGNHHRRPRRLLGIAAAIVLIAGAVTWSARRDGQNRVITDQTPTSSTVPTVPDRAGLEAVIDSNLYDLSTDPPRIVDLGARPASAPNAEPVRTKGGLVTLTALDRGRGDLVIVGSAGPRTLARGVYAFAVDAAGDRVAYATASGAINEIGGTTTLTVARFDLDVIEGRVSFRGFDGSGSFAAPVGWAGPHVLLNTGDGAGTRAAVWTPSDGSISSIGYGTVLLTEPATAMAVVIAGDGSCGSLLRVSPDASLATPSPALGTICRPSAFSPDGQLVASVQGNGDLTVTRLADPSSPRATFPAAGAGLAFDDDLTWIDNERVAIARPGKLTICTVNRACATSALPGTSSPKIVHRRDTSGPPRTTTTTAPTYTRPPLADTAVAITADELHLIDTRTGSTIHKISLRVPLTADGATRLLDFVEISPDKNTAIVTAAEKGGSRYSLWTIDLRTDTVALLSNDAVWPAFSPDGATLAYTRSQGPREGGDTIVLRDLATGRERSLVRAGVSGLSKVSTSAWSPDSRTLAYSYGYYGYDTYLVDVASANSLDDARKLENVAIIDWRQPDQAFVSWFCCFEAEPPVVSDYGISTGAHTRADVPDLFGFINRNDQDGRLAGVDASSGTNVVRYTNTSGTLVALPGYRHLAW